MCLSQITLPPGGKLLANALMFKKKQGVGVANQSFIQMRRCDVNILLAVAIGVVVDRLAQGLQTPAVAEKAILDGDTDMVSLGRQALADAEWPNKVREGRVNEITFCNKDNFCLRIGLWGGQASMRCTVNPELMKEEFNPKFWPKPLKGRVAPTLMRWKPGLRWQKTDQSYIDLENRRKQKEKEEKQP